MRRALFFTAVLALSITFSTSSDGNSTKEEEDDGDETENSNEKNGTIDTLNLTTLIMPKRRKDLDKRPTALKQEFDQNKTDFETSTHSILPTTTTTTTTTTTIKQETQKIVTPEEIKTTTAKQDRVQRRNNYETSTTNDAKQETTKITTPEEIKVSSTKQEVVHGKHNFETSTATTVKQEIPKIVTQEEVKITTAKQEGPRTTTENKLTTATEDKKIVQIFEQSNSTTAKLTTTPQTISTQDDGKTSDKAVVQLTSPSDPDDTEISIEEKRRFLQKLAMQAVFNAPSTPENSVMQTSPTDGNGCFLGLDSLDVELKSVQLQKNLNSIDSVLTKLNELEKLVLRPTAKLAKTVKKAKTAKTHFEAIGDKQKCQLPIRWKPEKKDNIVFCSSLNSLRPYEAIFRFCTHYVIDVPQKAQLSNENAFMKALKNAGIQSVLRLSANLRSNYSLQYKTESIKNLVESIPVDGVLIDWSEEDLKLLNLKSDYVATLVPSLDAFLNPSQKKLFLRPEGYANLADVPYFKNLQKYADFWIAGTVKYPKLVETAVDSLADLEKNIKLNSKAVDPKKLVYETMKWPLPSYVLKIAKSSAIGSPAQIFTGEGYYNNDWFAQYPEEFESFSAICDPSSTGFLEKFYTKIGGSPGAYATASSLHWASFDGPTILKLKMQTLKKYDVAGASVANLDGDDSSGWKCRCGHYPLLRTISDQLRGTGNCEVDVCLA